MSAKRWFVDKTNEHGNKNQVGGGSKTGDKARAVVQRMKAQQKRGDGNSFTVREGKKG